MQYGAADRYASIRAGKDRKINSNNLFPGEFQRNVNLHCLIVLAGRLTVKANNKSGGAEC